MKTLREGTLSLLPTPRQAKEAFTVDETASFLALHQRESPRV